MIEKIFDYLPYDFLERVKFAHLLFVGAAIGGLMFAGYYFTIYQVTHEELVKLQKQKTQVQNKLESYQRLVAQKETIAKDLVRSTGHLEAMKQQLPREKELPGLLKEVAGFGGGRGAFDVMKFQLEEGNIDDFYKEIPVAIQMRGSFWDTLDFLDKMQNRLQLVNFSDLTMDLRTTNSNSVDTESEVPSASTPVLYTKLVASTYAYIDGAENKVTAVANKAAKNN